MTTRNLHSSKPDHPKAVIRQDRSFFRSVTTIKLTALPLLFKILRIGHAGNCVQGLDNQLQRLFEDVRYKGEQLVKSIF